MNHSQQLPAETDIRWIPDEVKEKLGISKVLNHGMLTFETPQFVETINLQHINAQRERYALNSSSYLDSVLCQILQSKNCILPVL